MIISPNSIIRILSNVKLKKDLSHTFLFGSAGAQASYFSSKTAYTLNAQSYQRSYSNKMRIEKNIDDLYNCNYLMFQNTSFGSKWFYAFITDMEYINNVTTEITYEIDAMQTFLFEGQLNPCFVERQHAESDNIGENILPEPVDTGEMVYDISSNPYVLGTLSMCVIIAVVEATSGIDGHKIDQIYSGCKLYAYAPGDTVAIENKLDSYISNPNKIVGLYMAPASLVTNNSVVPAGGIEVTGTIVRKYYFDKPTGNESFGTYTNIKNKKLFTYPFNYLQVSTPTGQSLNLRYEFFKNDSSYPQRPYLEYFGSVLQPVQVVLRPAKYKGVDSHSMGDPISMTEQLTLDSYPQCCWALDGFKQWVAQNSVPIALNTVTGVAASAIAGGPMAAAATAFSRTKELVTEGYKASIAADQCRGNVNSGNANIAHGVHSFFVARARLSPDYARMIDNFFTIYGYAQKRVMTPNRNARTEFTYIKTVDSNVSGNIPANYLEHINAAYNKGITFWNNPDHIYNYNVDNSPYDY